MKALKKFLDKADNISSNAEKVLRKKSTTIFQEIERESCVECSVFHPVFIFYIQKSLDRRVFKVHLLYPLCLHLVLV
mgnify:CR=1 FL=1